MIRRKSTVNWKDLEKNQGKIVDELNHRVVEILQKAVETYKININRKDDRI